MEGGEGGEGFMFVIAKVAYTARCGTICMRAAQPVDRDGILNVKTPFPFILPFLFCFPLIICKLN